MPSRYKLLIDVRNAFVEFDGRLERVGFFVTRIKEADGWEQAFEAAKAELIASPEFRKVVRNRDGQPPTVLLDEFEVVLGDETDDVETDFLFYEEPSN